MESKDQQETPTKTPAAQHPGFKIIAGLIISSVVGFFVFGWLAGVGLYGPMIPAAFPGLGINLTSNRRSYVLGAVAAVVGGGLAVLAEWKNFPFITDGSLSFFLSNLSELSGRTHLLMLVGVALGFFLGTNFSKAPKS